MMPRLFIDSPLAVGEEVALGREQAHYLARVLRLGEGDSLRVFNGEGGNGKGGEFASVILRANKKEATIQIGELMKSAAESHLRIYIGQGAFESGKMDWAIEKMTELGLAGIAPLICRQSARIRGDIAARWSRVVIAACQQCGRSQLPEITPPLSLEKWIYNMPSDAARILLTPSGGGGVKSLADKLKHKPTIYALIGPRPGLTEEEERIAVAAGFEAITLGPRVLRVETAGIAAIAALQAIAGDFA